MFKEFWEELKEHLGFENTTEPEGKEHADLVKKLEETMLGWRERLEAASLHPLRISHGMTTWDSNNPTKLKDVYGSSSSPINIRRSYATALQVCTSIVKLEAHVDQYIQQAKVKRQDFDSMFKNKEPKEPKGQTFAQVNARIIRNLPK